VKLALENVNSEYILTKGTDLKKLFEKIAMLSDESKKVILFSDGGDELISDDLIGFVQEEKIEILAVATATVEGASIKDKEGKLLQDQKGHIVVSKLNEDLERLANESGGEMIAFDSVDEVVNKMLSWLDEKSREEGIKKESRSYFELAFVPLILALLLFLVASTNLSKKVVILLLLVGINVEANEILTKDNWGGGSEIKALKVQKGWSFLEGYYLKRAYVLYSDGDYKASLAYLFKIENRKVEAELLLAHNYYKLSMYKRAKLVLERIKSRDRALKQQLYYELGNCEYKLEYMAKAKAFYIKALQLGVDADAEHNLKLAIFQEAKHSLKTGAYNPSDAVHSDNKSDDEREELDEVEGKNKKKSSNTSGGTAGGGAKKNKVSTVKVVKSDKKMKNSKRVMASKAYDLINEGYIQEKKPW
jgi:Ca-activated chloride channel family protein